VDRERIELSIFGCKPNVFPLALTAQNLFKVHLQELNLPTLDIAKAVIRYISVAYAFVYFKKMIDYLSHYTPPIKASQLGTQ
jgi:hypothetical protein